MGLPSGHQYESPWGHWRFIQSLTLEPDGISRMRVSCRGHPRLSKKKFSVGSGLLILRCVQLCSVGASIKFVSFLLVEALYS